MRLDFKKIEVHSFMSFEDEVFNFNEHKGLTLVKGINHDMNGDPNGAGKSTIFASLLYTLFGETQDKIKNEHIVNRYASDKDMRLVLQFSTDGEDYKVIRGLVKGRSSYLNLLKTNKDGKETDLTKSSISETQEYLEAEVLHCDISIFLRTILLTADQTYNFYKLKKADKKDFVEKLFDIGVFGDMYSLIHKDILALDKSILSHQSKLLVLSKNIEDYEARKNKYDTSKAEKVKLLTESLSKLQKESDELSNKEVKVNTDAVKKLQDALSKIEDAKDKATVSLQEAKQNVSDAEVSISKCKIIKSSKMQIINKHSELLSKLCNDCKPVFSQYYSLDEAKKAVTEAEIKLSACIASRDKASTDVKKLKDKITEYTNKAKIANDRINNLTNEASKLNNAKSMLEYKLNAAKRDLKNAEAETNPYVEMLADNSKSIEAENNELNRIEDKYSYLKLAENIVSQETLRKLIIKDLISLLNNKVKTYLTKLGANYYVQFNEDMDYDFVTTKGTCEFGNFSAGEKMRTMIATSFAFRDFMSIRNGLNSNLLVLDEYFDSAISGMCIENMLEILKGFSRDYNQNIYIISHRPEVSEDNFKQIMVVEKQHDMSRITVKSNN